ncbi:hypothetical protein OCHUTO_0266 [Orientia chuto str. Dubai]|uniref:Uncharacterized protein n=2 Tax=Candidatus Orientia mediorientalis TaxID=911112 RepID=A0A0F3MMJ5_9RICK|nr:hypothetical protein OCHUTO_0266 [Orientia chuto str. Dubai]
MEVGVCHTLCGYRALIDCYRVLYNKNDVELRKMSFHLKEMFKANFPLAMLRENSEFQKEQIAKKIMENLNNTGVAYICCNDFKGAAHQTIVKMVKNDTDKYCVTLYNAGFGAHNAELTDLDELLKMNGITNYRTQSLYNRIKYYINAYWYHEKQPIYSGIKYYIDDIPQPKDLIESVILRQTNSVSIDIYILV